MKPLKLRTKLTLIYAAVFTLLLAGVSALFYKLLEYQLDKALAQELTERADALRGYLRFEGDRPRFVFDASDPDEASFVTTATRYFQIYDADSGALIARSPEMEAMRFQYTPEEVGELIKVPQQSGLQTDQANLLVSSDVVHTANGRSYLVQIGVSLGPRDTALSHLLRISLWLVPAGTLLALLLGWWMARRVLQPVEALSGAAREIGISELHKRLPIRGAGDELDRLAIAFNEVLERLEKAVAQMKDFTASISHELRTPLTALRGEAEIALAQAGTESECRRVLESQLEEFEKLTRMINQMLTLARAEAGQIELARDTANLSALARSLVEQMEPVASSKGVSLSTRQDGDVMVTGDASWLERAVLNLIDNAIKFTPGGGAVEVSVRRQGSEAILEVIDNGVGITQQALPHVFERFYRGDPSRSSETEGTGLGLSLVEWIVREHRGRVGVESRPGKGSIFRITLPLASHKSEPGA
jgi:heavy metal sensor kinase